jgi:hypothetical protein
MHEFARISQAIIHGAAQSEKLPDPSNNLKYDSIEIFIIASGLG